MSGFVEDLSPREAVQAFAAFAKACSSKCDIYVSLNVGRPSAPPLHASIYPNGITGKVHIGTEAATWRDLLAACEERWAGHADLHAHNVIREMALAIIAITADHGECTDAALRSKFDTLDVAKYGELACEAATTMASNGPFSIVRLAGANDVVAA